MKPSSDKNRNDINTKNYNDNGNNSNSSSNLYASSQTNNVKIPASAWKVLALLSCIATMVMYAETMLIPAIPDLIKDFHVSYSMSSWILTAYLVAGAVMTPIAGKLSDIYGRKKILLIIMVIYAVGVSLSAFATNIYFMIVARAIQGIGMSMFPIAFGIVRDVFPREKISIGQGVITSMFASGAVIGLAVGGIIIQNYGWRSTFFTIIPIAIVLLLIIRRFINVDDGEQQLQEQEEQEEHLQKQSKIVENNRHNNNSNNNIEDRRTNKNYESSSKRIANQIDVKGAVTLAATITLFLLVLTFIETSGGSSATATNMTNSNINNSSNSSTTLLPFLITGGIISFILFIVVERRSKYPLVDFRLMLNKSILPANLIIMLVGLSMFMVFQTIPILVRNPEPVGFGEDAISTWKSTAAFCHSAINIWSNFWVYRIKIRLIKTNNIWHLYNCCRFYWFACVPFYRVISFN